MEDQSNFVQVLVRIRNPLVDEIKEIATKSPRIPTKTIKKSTSKSPVSKSIFNLI